MIVVSDTSPLSYLILIGHIDVLPALFGGVVVPPAVMVELTHPGSPDPVRAWVATPPAWIWVAAPAVTPAARPGIDPGEAQAIELARELSANALLIDDARGRAAAEEAGVPARGTLGVLVLAARTELLDLDAALSRLQATNFRASPALFQRLRDAR
ncbi:MAG: DUF3368 domain-containing protein [Phycisphaerales bacterium]|nr:DUF3368 domain-containing protein [Phycisphaerales bacterium]